MSIVGLLVHGERGGGVGSTGMENSYCLIEVTWFYVDHEDVLAIPHLSVYS